MRLEERVDLRAVKYLNSMPKAWWKKIIYCDQKIKFEVEYAKVKSFLHGQLDGSGVCREYHYANNSTFGRLFDQSGLQGMQRAIRGVLCRNVMSDLDIINCHPNILYYICKKNDISCPMLEYYISNRDQVLKDIMQSDYDREDAKKFFLKSTNTSWRLKLSERMTFLRDYDAEMKRLQKEIFKLEMYDFVKPKVKKGDNEDGSFINLCLCFHENEIIQKAKSFLESKKIQISTLAFDGLMHYGEQQSSLVEELNEYTLKEFGFPFKFIYKEFNNDIKVPESFDENSVVSHSYKIKCEEFNKTHAKVGDKYICEDILGKKIIHTEMQLKQRYKHIRVYDKEEQFIDAWVKNVPDTNMRVYQMFDIHPVASMCPLEAYNLWEPFAMEKKTGDYEKDPDALEKILHLVACLGNHEEKSIKFLLDWMAQMIQYPHIKSLVPVIQSDEGVGKNTLMDILRQILGDDKVWDCTDPLRDIFGNFNDQMKDKFLININETSSKDFKGVMGKVKAFVTDETFTLRAMQQGATSLNSFHRFCMNTNNEFPIQTTEGQRRFGIIRASSELKGNKDFFSHMYKNIIKSENAMRTFYDYLKDRPVNEKMSVEDLPDTEYQRLLNKNNEHPIIQWLEHLAETKKETELTFNSYNLFDNYTEFCIMNRIPYDKMTKRGFETSLSIKRIPGVSKKNNGKSRLTVLDMEELRAHFKIDEILEEYQIADDIE